MSIALFLSFLSTCSFSQKPHKTLPEKALDKPVVTQLVNWGARISTKWPLTTNREMYFFFSCIFQKCFGENERECSRLFFSCFYRANHLLSGFCLYLLSICNSMYLHVYIYLSIYCVGLFKIYSISRWFSSLVCSWCNLHLRDLTRGINGEVKLMWGGLVLSLM